MKIDRIIVGRGEERSSGPSPLVLSSGSGGGRGNRERNDFPSGPAERVRQGGMEWKGCSTSAGALVYDKIDPDLFKINHRNTDDFRIGAQSKYLEKGVR